MPSNPNLNSDRFTCEVQGDHWPPNGYSLVHVAPSKKYMVVLTPAGEIAIITNPGVLGYDKQWISQPIILELLPGFNKNGYEIRQLCFHLEISIGDVKDFNDIHVWCNKVHLHNLPVKRLISINTIRIKPKRLYEAILPERVIGNQEEWMLLETLKDLEQRIALQDNYNSIKASGLVRLLIAEEKLTELHNTKSLGVRLAEKYNIPLEFEILKKERKPPEERLNAVTNLPDEDTSYSYNILQDYYPVLPTVFLNREEFLKTVVLWTADKTTTIHTVIKTVAESSGGVHFGEPESLKPEKNRLLDFENQKVLSQPISWKLMPEIGQVVLNSFWPLAQAILQKLS